MHPVARHDVERRQLHSGQLDGDRLPVQLTAISCPQYDAELVDTGPCGVGGGDVEPQRGPAVGARRNLTVREGTQYVRVEPWLVPLVVGVVPLEGEQVTGHELHARHSDQAGGRTLDAYLDR